MASNIPSSSVIPPPPADRQLYFKDGPLVWIDCEMTGLDSEKERILEVACIITDAQLQPLDEGVSYVISTSKEVLDGMGEWCVSSDSIRRERTSCIMKNIRQLTSSLCLDPSTHQVNQHKSSGLTAACLSLEASRSHADVRAAILAYVRDRVPSRMSACLAGNSIHADKTFLVKEMPELIDHLHYRLVDVSTIKELVRRFYGGDKENFWNKGKGSHRALDDIRDSIEELKFYKENYFKDKKEIGK